MSDLISRQAALDAMETWDWQELYLPIHFKQLLEELPSAERRGHWIKKNGLYECSECGVWFPHRSAYCRDCGAKMDKGVGE